MVKLIGRICLMVLVSALLGIVSVAQEGGSAGESVSAPAPATTPTLDELDLARVQTVQVAMKRANDACQVLEAVTEYNQLRATTQRQIEAKHQGYTMNWATFELVPKAPRSGP